MQSAWTKTFNQLSNPARPKNCANYSTLQGYIIIEKNKVSQAKQARQNNGNHNACLQNSKAEMEKAGEPGIHN